MEKSLNDENDTDKINGKIKYRKLETTMDSLKRISLVYKTVVVVRSDEMRVSDTDF